MLRFLVPMLVALVVLAGCGETIRSGRFMIDKEVADEQFPHIKERASFDLSCPRSGLTIVTLAASGSDYDVPVQAGVTGCGKRAVYVNIRGAGWVLDSVIK
jgi:hypothetical protein